MQKNRKLNRLNGYDYSKDGWYFVTICTKNKEPFFGEIKEKKMVLNKFGKVAKNCWLAIPEHFPHCMLDEFIIMPNHIHGILLIKNAVGNKNFCSLQHEIKIPWQKKLSRSLSSIVRGFKIGVTKYFRQQEDFYFSWQKSFYDHIIRNEKSLNNIRQYILDNPSKWEDDPDNLSKI